MYQDIKLLSKNGSLFNFYISIMLVLQMYDIYYMIEIILFSYDDVNKVIIEITVF